MPKLRVGSQADSGDNRTNLFIPVGMDAMVETEIYGAISCGSGSGGRKTLSTFGKEQRDSTIQVANVKPYFKSQRTLSPPLQESESASSGSPTKMDPLPLDEAKQESKEEREGGSDSSAYGPPDGQCSPLHTVVEEPSYVTCDLRPKSLSRNLIHSSVITQECGGPHCPLDPRDSGNWPITWSSATCVMWWPQINDQEVFFFLSRHALYNQKPSALYVLSLLCDLLCLGELCVLDCCDDGGRWGRKSSASNWLQKCVFMVYCTCQFRCLYFAHLERRLCEAVEQIATVKLLSPVCFCTVKLFCLHLVFKVHLFNIMTNRNTYQWRYIQKWSVLWTV